MLVPNSPHVGPRPSEVMMTFKRRNDFYGSSTISKFLAALAAPSANRSGNRTDASCMLRLHRQRPTVQNESTGFSKSTRGGSGGPFEGTPGTAMGPVRTIGSDDDGQSTPAVKIRLIQSNQGTAGLVFNSLRTGQLRI